MGTATLRLDWYSFILGTQISATTGILNSSSYSSLTRLRFPREYVFPSIHNGGNTIIFYRIKEKGNWYKEIFKLFCRMLEKNILGGSLYLLIDVQQIRETSDEDPSTARMKTFFFGGFLGICFCFRYNWHTSVWEGIGSWLSAAELAVSGEEIKRLILEDNMLKYEDFKIPIPYERASFISGAFTGCIHGLFFSSIGDWLGEIQVPQRTEYDTRLEYCTKCVRVGFDVFGRFLKVAIFFVERCLVGGVLLCTFDMLGRRITGWNNSMRILPVSGLLLGLYLGADSTGSFGKAWRSLASTAYSSRLAIAIFYEVVSLL